MLSMGGTLNSLQTSVSLNREPVPILQAWPLPATVMSSMVTQKHDLAALAATPSPSKYAQESSRLSATSGHLHP